MWKIYNLKLKKWGESTQDTKRKALDELGWWGDPCQCYVVGMGGNVRKPFWGERRDTHLCPRCKRLWSKHIDGICPTKRPETYWAEVYGWNKKEGE